jgi:hypothetical protein
VLIIAADDPWHQSYELRLNPGADFRIVQDRLGIGIFSYAAGPDVFAVDRHGLADPLAARLTAEQDGRIGHDKLLAEAWVIARYADRTQPLPPGSATAPDVSAAANALGCEPIRDLYDHVEGELSVADFFGNLVVSWRLQRLVVPADPKTAVGQLCP